MTIITPIITCAATPFLYGGISQVNKTTSYTWASCEYKMVIAKHQKYDVTDTKLGWQSVSTKPLLVNKNCIIRAEWGYDGRFYSSATTTQKI